MGLLINVLIAAIVAVVFYVVCTSFIVFQSSNLIFGLIAVVIFLVIAFGGGVGRLRAP